MSDKRHSNRYEQHVLLEIVVHTDKRVVYPFGIYKLITCDSIIIKMFNAGDSGDFDR